MKLNLDRSFRVVWLVVGGLVLLFLLVGGVLIAVQWIGNTGAADDAVRVASEAQPARDEPRAVRYGMPQRMRGTDTRIVLVSYGEGDQVPGSSTEYGVYDQRGGGGTWVNAVFMDDAGARLLLDRPAYIRDVTYPVLEGAPYPRADSLQAWITYLMAVDDTDRNGKLDHRDRTGLYVSDVEGGNLRPALRPPLRYTSHQAMAGGRILVYALEPPAGQHVDEKRMRQRAFVYDVASGRLTPHAALDSAAARAGQILGR
ncbi:MAG TPA: hypothetical protein VE871_03245 [Longimicrobium sp.]|nr:hypothetical protein [Longimicrobium sp.]